MTCSRKPPFAAHTRATLYLWRHPKPIDAQGLCLGHTDVTVERRKLKRLANQIQAFTRRHRLPKVIWLSTLQRSRGVGALLAKRGFSCQTSPLLCEMNFGTWDGQPWAHIAKTDIDAWCADFADFKVGGGESVRSLCQRVSLMFEQWLTFSAEQRRNARHLSANDLRLGASILVVGHGGWITAASRLWLGQALPLAASDWPAPPNYRQLRILAPREHAH